VTALRDVLRRTRGKHSSKEETVWEKIKTQTVSAVLAAVIIALVAAIWQSVTNGGLIEALGGVPMAELEELVPQVDLADLKVVSLVTPQNAASPNLDCGDGWRETSARFHESYRQGNTQREQHFLICINSD